MLSLYTPAIKTALLFFPFLALLISSFVFIYHYRKFGRFLFFKGIVLYSFVFYLLCAYFLVILPLPSFQAVAARPAPKIEWLLGASFQNFLKETVLNPFEPNTYLAALKQSVVLEPVFNVLLLLPLGVYLRYYFKFSLKKTLIVSFCLSLFFELTQLTGLYFIYPHAYRTFDVNDLLHNTIGGVLGYWLAPLFVSFLPTKDALDAKAYEQGKTVTFLRRLAAFAVDWSILGLFSMILVATIRFITGNKQLDFTNAYWYLAFLVLFYFVLGCYLLKGQTIGKKLVKIRLMEEKKDRISIVALGKRYGLLYLVYLSIGRLNVLLAPGLKSNHLLLLITSLLIFSLILLVQGCFYLNLCWGIIRKQRRFSYEIISKTYLVSLIHLKEE